MRSNVPINISVRACVRACACVCVHLFVHVCIVVMCYAKFADLFRLYTVSMAYHSYAIDTFIPSYLHYISCPFTSFSQLPSVRGAGQTLSL